MTNDDSLRRKKGADSVMISGQIEVKILLAHEKDEDPDFHIDIIFTADTLKECIDVRINIPGDGALFFTMTPPEFNGVVAQLGRMKSALNAIKGTNK